MFRIQKGLIKQILGQNKVNSHVVACYLLLREIMFMQRNDKKIYFAENLNGCYSFPGKKLTLPDLMSENPGYQQRSFVANSYFETYKNTDRM